METLLYIDLYCERNAAHFWNEPLNALSNLAFVLVAVIAWNYARRQQLNDAWQYIVIILAGLIGAGSFLFHTFASSWAEIADIIPIWLFVFSYTLLTIYRLTQESVVKTLLIAAFILTISLTVAIYTSADLTNDTPRQPLVLNGSLQYAPAVVILVIFTLAAQLRAHPIRHHLWAATGLFLVALLFRTIDQSSCNITHGHGTHFLWHIFDALMIAVLLHAMIRHMQHHNTYSVPLH